MECESSEKANKFINRIDAIEKQIYYKELEKKYANNLDIAPKIITRYAVICRSRILKIFYTIQHAQLFLRQISKKCGYFVVEGDGKLDMYEKMGDEKPFLSFYTMPFDEVVDNEISVLLRKKSKEAYEERETFCDEYDY